MTKQINFILEREHRADCGLPDEVRNGYFNTVWTRDESSLVGLNKNGKGRGRNFFVRYRCMNCDCKAKALFRMDAISDFIGSLDTSIKRGRKRKAVASGK